MYLEKIDSPDDLKKIERKELPLVADEIRKKMLEVTSKTGGHLSSSLGVVELTIALHYVFSAPIDKIIWDVSHQCYAHKMLTGRYKNFDTLRQHDGISGFTNKNESVYDVMTCGHSSASISNALGMAIARDIKGTNEKIIAVIGDGSLGGGMAFEALNHAGHLQKDLTVILNSNEMAISPSIGALSKYLNRILTNRLFNKVRDDLKEFLGKIPRVGKKAVEAARRFEEGLKNLVVPGMFFEEIGLRYFGPIDGHDINLVIETLEKTKVIKGVKLIHFVTKKGKGYLPAEEDPARFHSAKPFNIEDGADKDGIKEGEISFTEAFSKSLVEIADKNSKITAVTAAMPDGAGVKAFSLKFPERFFDVGIAEQHAIGFSAGLSRSGFIPVVAIYSTFLQRAYDQLIHDIALQDLKIILAIDRAGLVGGDGPTHSGVFDIAYLRSIPNMVIMAPKDGEELSLMLQTAMEIPQSAAIRYPKENTKDFEFKEGKIEFAASEILRKGRDAVVISVGDRFLAALAAADILKKQGIEVEVINARFIKPLDEKMLERAAKQFKKIVIVEDACVRGSFGSAVLEFYGEKNLCPDVRLLGIPDKFIAHGKREIVLKECGLDAQAIVTQILH
ncbi:MAG: 1-deoxy-D-xylulose-5-phosphate synthase [Candidatus Omnitrophota bacterium]